MRLWLRFLQRIVQMNLLKELYQTNGKSGHEDEIKSIVRKEVSAVDATIAEDSFGNLFVTKGVAKEYPCVAAHLDEVHEPVQRHIVEENNRLFALDGDGNSIGIGADDKNGVWLALRLLKEVPIVKVALFVQEEKDGDLSGCRGSNACDLHWFNDVKYVIECDRKGCNDIVTFSEKAGIRLCDDNFIPQRLCIEYGYNPVNGGKTDVTALKQRGLAIPCCNISCGYYNAHSDEEYTVIGELLNCYDFVKKIVETI